MNTTKKQILNIESYLGVQKQAGTYEKEYIEKVQKFCKMFRFIPGLLLVGIGNSLAMNAGEKKSDIDLFVVTKNNALWFVRIIMTFIVAIRGERKTQKEHAGKICLSFFCTDEVLDFSDIAYENDIYLYYWVLTMKPILTRGDVYEKFVEKNSWVDFSAHENVHKSYSDYLKYTLTDSGEVNVLVKYIDKLFKKLLLSRSIKKYENLGKPEGVIINEGMLKFHDKDKRKYIRENVLEKI